MFVVVVGLAVGLPMTAHQKILNEQQKNRGGECDWNFQLTDSFLFLHQFFLFIVMIQFYLEFCQDFA
jgi:hypothetical protein